MRLTILLSVCLVTGCAPLLEDLQTINANLKTANSNLGTSTPSVHTVTATAVSICNQAAYEDGFKRKYTRAFGLAISTKATLSLAVAQQNPNDAAAQHNYALYNRKVGLPKMGTSIYGPGNTDDPCARQSYEKGQQDGEQAADRDIRALEAQES